MLNEAGRQAAAPGRAGQGRNSARAGGEGEGAGGTTTGNQKHNNAPARACNTRRMLNERCLCRGEEGEKGWLGNLLHLSVATSSVAAAESQQPVLRVDFRFCFRFTYQNNYAFFLRSARERKGRWGRERKEGEGKQSCALQLPSRPHWLWR